MSLNLPAGQDTGEAPNSTEGSGAYWGQGRGLTGSGLWISIPRRAEPPPLVPVPECQALTGSGDLNLTGGGYASACGREHAHAWAILLTSCWPLPAPSWSFS